MMPETRTSIALENGIRVNANMDRRVIQMAERSAALLIAKLADTDLARHVGATDMQIAALIIKDLCWQLAETNAALTQARGGSVM